MNIFPPIPNKPVHELLLNKGSVPVYVGGCPLSSARDGIKVSPGECLSTWLPLYVYSPFTAKARFIVMSTTSHQFLVFSNKHAMYTYIISTEEYTQEVIRLALSVDRGHIYSFHLIDKPYK